MEKVKTWIGLLACTCLALWLAFLQYESHQMKNEIAHIRAELDRSRCACDTAPTRAATLPVPTPRPAQIMEVYVRPHPPAFLAGQWVRFESYEKFSEAGVEKIKFLYNQQFTIVNSEAVEWPKQRIASVVR